MSVLDKIQRGRRHRPLTATIYGVPGVGKTTFGAAAPNPVIHCLERGADHLDVSKLDAPASWDVFLTEVRELGTADHGFGTYVVDTLDALETIAISHVCAKAKKNTLADFDWGGGYALLVQEWRLFLKALEVLRDRRDMNIVLIAHEHRKAYADPELGQYEVYRPKLQDKVWALTNEWSDAVLFAQFDQALLEKNGQKARAIVSGRRILRTERGTGYVAKNRYGLPPVIDLDWRTFEAAAQPVSAEQLKSRLEELLAKAPDDTVKKARAYLKDRGESTETLRAACERVQTLLAAPAA